MDVKVYLSNGNILEFSQTDTAIEKEVVAEINAGRLFLGRSVILGGGETCTMLQFGAISRVDVLASVPLAVPLTLEGNLKLIESDEEYRQKAEQAKKFHHDGVAPGEEFEGCLQFDLAGKHRLQLSFQGVLRDQLQFFTNLRRVFEIPVMWFEHPGGGMIALNVQNILSISSAPGFSHYPKGTLLVKAM